MTEVTQFYLDLIRCLALPAAEQGSYFGEAIPERSSHRAGEWPEGRNGMVDLLRFILEVSSSRELEGNSEIEQELLEVVTLMLSSSDGKLWHKGALESSPAWRLLRRLAGRWLESISEKPRKPQKSFAELIR